VEKSKNRGVGGRRYTCAVRLQIKGSDRQLKEMKFSLFRLLKDSSTLMRLHRIKPLPV
jgi:hypothetical protein